MTVMAAKPKRTKDPPQTKLCPHCGKVKPIKDFFRNRDWEEQMGYDLWCRDCVAKCSTKDQIKEYFWENHREWTERVWETAGKKAEAAAANNITFQKSTGDRREKLMEKLTCSQVPSIMLQFYKYVDPTKTSGALSYQEAKERGEVIEEDPNVKVYSEEFNGMFKPAELHYLQEYYRNLEEDYNLDTENMRDYARKVAKASMLADKMQDDYSAGRLMDFDVVQKAMTQFDTLSKSASLAACKRKDGDGNVIGSWGEMAKYLEMNGHPMQKPVVWEKDDVDLAIEELRHIVRAIGLDD